MGGGANQGSYHFRAQMSKNWKGEFTDQNVGSGTTPFASPECRASFNDNRYGSLKKSQVRYLYGQYLTETRLIGYSVFLPKRSE